MWKYCSCGGITSPRWEYFSCGEIIVDVMGSIAAMVGALRLVGVLQLWSENCNCGWSTAAVVGILRLWWEYWSSVRRTETVLEFCSCGGRTVICGRRTAAVVGEL
jgi:hypothetical protein